MNNKNIPFLVISIIVLLLGIIVYDEIAWVIISALLLGAVIYSQPTRLLRLLNQKIPLIVGIISVLINWLTLEKGFDLPIWFILNMLPFTIAMLTSFNFHEPNMFIFHMMVFAQWFYLTAIILERRKARRAELNLTFHKQTKD